MKKELIIGTLGAAVLVLAPFAAFAQTTAGLTTDVTAATANTSAAVTTGATTGKGVKAAASISTQISKGDTAIDARIKSLNDVSTRVGEMKEVSSTEKAALQSSISSQINTMTTLKAKIDADTDETTLKADLESITKDYRIYMLVLPQARIAAADDSATTVVGQMQNISTLLSARITAAQAAGKNVSGAQAAYTDMQAKVSDANTQASAALSETASLQPDQGNATVAASNTAAIKDAASKLKTAETDLKAARADITTIEAAVKGTGSGSVTASSSASAQ